MAIGHINPLNVVRGVNLVGSGNADLLLGPIPASSSIRGVDVNVSGYADAGTVTGISVIEADEKHYSYRNYVPDLNPWKNIPHVGPLVDKIQSYLSSAIQGVLDIRKDGTSVAIRPALNFTEGANIAITATDDGGNEEVDVEIAVDNTGAIQFEDLILRDTYSNIPSAATEGRLFFSTDTDEAYRDNGTTWDKLIIDEPVADTVTILSRATTPVNVVSTASEITLLSYSVPGGMLGVDKMIKLTAYGDSLYNNSTSDTITIRLKYGTTTIASWTSTSSLSATRKSFHLECNLMASGATNTQYGRVWAALRFGGNDFRISEIANGTGAENSTGTLTVSVTAQWSASSTNNSWKMNYGNIELL